MHTSGQYPTPTDFRYRAPVPPIGHRMASLAFALRAAAVTDADRQFATDVGKSRYKCKSFDRITRLARRCGIEIKAEVIAMVREALSSGPDEEAPAIVTAFSQYVRAHHGISLWEHRVFGSTPSRADYEAGAKVYRVVEEAASECARALESVGRE